MTDLERLLEQVRDAEHRAFIDGYSARHWMNDVDVDMSDTAAGWARRAAHHALTAMALREVMAIAGYADEKGVGDLI